MIGPSYGATLEHCEGGESLDASDSTDLKIMLYMQIVLHHWQVL